MMDEKLQSHVSQQNVTAESTPKQLVNNTGKGGENTGLLRHKLPNYTRGQNCGPMRTNVIKSLSDSTLYTPAIQKAGKIRHTDELFNKISGFVESIRLESKAGGSGGDQQIPGTSGSSRQSAEINDDIEDDKLEPETEEQKEMRLAREKADKLILQSEHFKVTVSAPKGLIEFPYPMDFQSIKDRFITSEGGLAPVNEEIQWLCNFDQDNEFFHITCHVEESLKSKIAKGEFVDLERLLPSQKVGRSINEENGIFKFGMKEGQAFVTPVNESNGKITSVRRWDQAFRVYAAIYSKFNPSRASEIWQYIYVIHSASNSFPWENVAYYDYTFRQLMASKPWRSWRKTYTQAWNLALKTNNNSFGNFRHGGNGNGNGNGSGSSNYSYSNNNQQRKSRDWRDDCCRRFNKSKCTYSSRDCKWDHKCTYCGGWNHGISICRKKLGKNKDYTAPGPNNNHNQA